MVTLRTTALTVAFVAGLYAPAASAGVTIHFAPGPMDGEKIITPWGTYIALVQGNSVWVGTEAEYTDMHVRTLSHDMGLREFCSGGGVRCNNFIESGWPSVRVGNSELAEITVDTLFGEGPSKKLRRPPKAVSAEYVQVAWVQNSRAPVRVNILDQATKGALAPNDCGGDQQFRYCEFTVPRTTLTHPVSVAFVQAGQKPAVMPGRSLAWLSYDTIAQHIRSLAKSKIVVDPNDKEDTSYADAAHLHAIDPAIPSDPGSETAAHAAQQASAQPSEEAKRVADEQVTAAAKARRAAYDQQHPRDGKYVYRCGVPMPPELRVKGDPANQTYCATVRVN